MGIKTYDLPPGGLKDGEIAKPSEDDKTFIWQYPQDELEKVEPTQSDINIYRKMSDGDKHDIVLTEKEIFEEARKKRYRKIKTQEFRKQYNEYLKEENDRYNKISKCIIKKRNTRKMCESK